MGNPTDATASKYILFEDLFQFSVAAEAQKETLPAGIAFDETEPNATPEPESGSAALQAGAGLLLALLVNIAAII